MTDFPTSHLDTSASLLRMSFANGSDTKELAARLRRDWIITPCVPVHPSHYCDTAPKPHADLAPTSLQKPNDCLPDLSTTYLSRVNTFWHEKIAYTYNHVFADTWRYLAALKPDLGNFDPPCEDLLTISHDATAQNPLSKTFENDVFVYPAFVAPGIRLVCRVGKEREGTFDGGNEDEIWWVKGGTKIEVSVRKEGSDGRDENVAAVLVLGKLGPVGMEEDTRVADGVEDVETVYEEFSDCSGGLDAGDGVDGTTDGTDSTGYTDDANGGYDINEDHERGENSNVEDIGH